MDVCGICSATPVYLSWIKYISWFHYGFESLAVNQWTGITGISCRHSKYQVDTQHVHTYIVLAVYMVLWQYRYTHYRTHTDQHHTCTE